MVTRFYIIELYENLLFLVHLLLDCQVEDNITNKLATQYGTSIKVAE